MRTTDYKITLANLVPQDPKGPGIYLRGWYHHNTCTIQLQSGSTYPGGPGKEDVKGGTATEENVEDIINHEVLHHVIQKIDGEDSSRQMDNLCYKVRNLGVLFENL